ncbi:glycosyltransferase [Halomonas shantousis]
MKEASGEKISVSVVIPTFHDWERLGLCLKALEEQSYPKSHYEIIVVNNDPDDSPSDISGDFVLISEHKPGSYAARNAGIRIAQGEVIAFTDSDCIPDKHWLENAVAQLREKKVDRVAGHVEVFFNNAKANATELYEKVVAFDQNKNANNGVSVTANFITYRREFSRVGYFNEELMSGGDFEWNGRATRLGLSIVYDDKCIVYHPARSSLEELKRKIRRVTYGTATYEKQPRFFFLRSLFPPISDFANIWRKKEMSAKEKLLASYVACYLKFYRALIRVKFKLGLEQASRT